MPTWYKMRCTHFFMSIILSIIGHIRVLKHSIIQSTTDYANTAIRIIQLCMNCGIIAVVMGIIFSIMSNLFEHCSKTK